jgi:hypothetical protein
MNTSVLNLNDDGSPLTFQRAMKGEFQAEWNHANDQEICKLVTTSEKMCLIHKNNIPSERRGDVMYYNPQVKQKIKDGIHVLRVRGTAGGDRINYTGLVSARTASLEVVQRANILVYSPPHLQTGMLALAGHTWHIVSRIFSVDAVKNGWMKTSITVSCWTPR